MIMLDQITKRKIDPARQILKNQYWYWIHEKK